MSAPFDSFDEILRSWAEDAQQAADQAQADYAAMTPEQRKALWAKEREGLRRIEAEAKAKGLTL
jgi:ElaB/YqjD/DUF883 family membrane-anchored ribosome-binding protein